MTPNIEAALKAEIELSREHPILVQYMGVLSSFGLHGHDHPDAPEADNGILEGEFFDAVLGGIIQQPESELGRAAMHLFNPSGDAKVEMYEAVWPVLWAVNQYKAECPTARDAIACFIRRLVIPEALVSGALLLF